MVLGSVHALIASARGGALLLSLKGTADTLMAPKRAAAIAARRTTEKDMTGMTIALGLNESKRTLVRF